MACSKLEARGHLLHKTGTPPNISAGSVLHKTCVYKALHLFFLPNFPDPTFIPCPTSIPEARVVKNLGTDHWFLAILTFIFLITKKWNIHICNNKNEWSWFWSYRWWSNSWLVWSKSSSPKPGSKKQTKLAIWLNLKDTQIFDHIDHGHGATVGWSGQISWPDCWFLTHFNFHLYHN